MQVHLEVASFNTIKRPRKENVTHCSPNPWLLQKRIQSLRYVGLYNDLDALLQVQARPVGEGYKGVSIIFFNYQMSVLLQNCLYSMVKFAGVCNYIVVVWDEPSLDVCLDMNLPCYNATSMIPGGVPIASDKEARLHTKDYNRITWMKPVVVQSVLEKDYVVHASDIDITYLPMNLWRSYMQYILEVNATAAFQKETKSIVNTGNYVILPTKAGKTFMSKWMATALDAIESGNHEQHALGELYRRKHPFAHCRDPKECKEKRQKYIKRKDFPLIRRTFSPWGSVYGSECAQKRLTSIHPVNPCSYPHLYFHAICLPGGSSAKMDALKKAGLWFMDDLGRGGCPMDTEEGGTRRATTMTPVRRCQPLAWRLPLIEKTFKECSWKERLAFRYYQSHNGVAFTSWGVQWGAP